MDKAWSHRPTVKIGETPIVLSFHRTATCKHDHVHYSARIHRTGEVVLAGRLRPVAVADGNADLRFDDKEKDRIYVDLDGDGRITTTTDEIAAGRPFLLRGETLVATVPSPDGSVVEFRTATPALKPTPRKWIPTKVNPYTLARPEKGATIDDLTKRFDGERKLPYAKRLGTLRAIAGLRDEASFRFLLKVVKDRGEHQGVRREAAQAMGQKAYAPFAKEVAAIARDESNPSQAEPALIALHWLDYPDRAGIYRSMTSSSQALIVRGAATGLVLMGDVERVHSLIADSANATTRAYAYSTLQYAKQAPSLKLMRAAARDEAPLVRNYALGDLQKLGLPDARTNALLSIEKASSYAALGYRVAEILGRAGDAESVKALFRLVSITPQSQIRQRILKELGPNRDPSATREYVKALKSRNREVRAIAASLLAALPDRKTTDALTKQARKEKDPVAMQAILEALGEHGDPRSIKLLLSVARKKDAGLRSAAIRALARIGPGIEKVRQFFLKLLDSSRWEDRVYALDAAGDVGDPSVAPKVIANLPHKEWQVRHAAAQALGKLRVREGVAPMITRLESEEVKRVRAALAHALFVTTGQNLYDFTETWKKWWRDHGADFKVPEEIPKRRKIDAGTVATFYGLPLDSGRVIFVIDQSGSMNAIDGSGKMRLQTAVSEVLAAAGRLKQRDKVNVILFESRVRSWKDKLVPLTNPNRSDLSNYLTRQRPTGGTNLYDAVELALQDRSVDTIFLLSDGAPGEGKFVATPDILREVGRRNQTRRIAIHCVSVGTESDLLKKLAAANGGQYVRR